MVAHTLAEDTKFLATPVVYFHIPYRIKTMIINDML